MEREDTGSCPTPATQVPGVRPDARGGLRERRPGHGLADVGLVDVEPKVPPFRPRHGPRPGAAPGQVLAEVIYLFETRQFLLGRVDGIRVRAPLRGLQPRGRPRRRSVAPRHELYGDVKAVTYHELKIEECDGFTVQVVVDIVRMEMDLRKIDEQHLGDPGPGRDEGPGRRLFLGPLLEDIRRDQTLARPATSPALPGIQGRSYVMPDAHQGYGFRSAASRPSIRPTGDHLAGRRRLRHQLRRPAGCGPTTPRRTSPPAGRSSWPRSSRGPGRVGKGGVTKLSRAVLKDILTRGAEWAVENGYGERKTWNGPRRAAGCGTPSAEDVSDRP